MVYPLALLLACCAGQFLFAGSETGFVTWNTLKIGYRAARGDVSARWALFMADHKDVLLAAVLIGNNVCVVGSALAFMAVYEHLDTLVPFDLSRLSSPESWILTPLLVVFCDMLPKSLFRIYSFRLTLKAVPLLMVTYWVTWPLSAAFSVVLKMMSGRHRGEEETGLLARKREQMLLVAKEGVRRGTLYEGADVPIRSILEMSGRCVGDIAAQGDVGPDLVLRLAPEATCADVRKQLEGIRVEQFVLVREGDGGLLGSVSVLDLLGAEPSVRIDRLVRPIPILQPDTPVLAVLQSSAPSFRRFIRIDERGTGGPYRVLDRLKVYQTLFGGLIDETELTSMSPCA